jgi:3-oxoacyl-[acyl-carrier protein] reductase
MTNMSEVMDRPCALIIGGTGGVGRALVNAFVAAGYDTVITYCARIDVARDAATRFPGRVEIAPLDLADTAQIQAHMDAALALSRRGWFDTVVLAAGLAGQPQMLMRGKAERVAELSQINFTGQICAVQALLRRLFVRTEGRKCSFVFVSSTSAVDGQPGMSVYAAAKAGIEQLFRCLASEYASRGFRFNIVRSGPLFTEMISQLPGRSLDALKERLDGGVIPEPEQIASFVLFAASAEQSRGMNGGVLHVDNGYCLYR